MIAISAAHEIAVQSESYGMNYLCMVENYSVPKVSAGVRSLTTLVSLHTSSQGDTPSMTSKKWACIAIVKCKNGMDGQYEGRTRDLGVSSIDVLLAPRSNQLS